MMNSIRRLNFKFGKDLPVILQTEGSECGLACMAMIATYHGYNTDLPEMRKRFQLTLKGATLDKLTDIADDLGLISRPLRLEMGHFKRLQTPTLLHWNMNHYVVLKSVHAKHVVIHDPAFGEMKLSFAEVSERFTGVALETAPGLNFQRKAASQPVQLRQLIGKIVGLKRGMLQILALAFVLEALALTMPVLTQWLTDDAIVGADRDLLTLLGIGMVMLGLSSALITALRTWIGLYISTHFNFQWMSNVMGHMLRLPVSYFERRHLGDIVSRFGAVRSIERGLTSAVIDTFLDGLLALGTLAMMVIYSPALTAVTVSIVVLYGALRWARYGSARAASAGGIVKEAKEQSYFLETIRGARSIKLFGRESERRAAWLNLWVDAANASLLTQKLNLLFATSWSVLSTLERATVLWLGASAVIEHKLTVGMLFAFLTYKEQFSARVNQLIDRVVDFKMLSLYAERLADIVLAVPEELNSYRRHDPPSDHTITFEKVNYRYASEERAILSSANVTIRHGECIAIVGPSGCGKTTCLKLMLGVLKPVSGTIKVGGLTISQLGTRGYRGMIGTVMQDDQLFAGSLYDNICFLDSKPDEDWLFQCAQAANIHKEIVEMPMGYHTLVGDMGTVLSGGQKQRVMLARALYRKPKILFLDEATSHLDAENESEIAASLAALDITRIMIAHRPQTIAIADRVFRLEHGKFVEQTVHTSKLTLASSDKTP